LASFNGRVTEEADLLDTSDWPDALDRDLAAPAIREFLDAAGEDLGEFELIITSRFEDAVRERYPPDLADIYYQTRAGFGEAMGKTMIGDDGCIAAIFDVRLFLKGASSPLPTFRHEGFHAMLYRAGEETLDRVDSLAERSHVLGRVLAIAAIVVEEYRVERAVLHIYPTRTRWSAFSSLCESTAKSIAAAILTCAKGSAQDLGPVAGAAFSSLEGLAVQTAYLAAELHADTAQTPRLRDAKLHERVLGPPWVDLIERLLTLPSADQRIDGATTDDVVLSVADVLDSWLTQLGFEFEVLDGGDLSVRVPAYRDWLKRALEDVASG
jgi:hypothetical protein